VDSPPCSGLRSVHYNEAWPDGRRGTALSNSQDRDDYESEWDLLAGAKRQKQNGHAIDHGYSPID
jgi:hypothetical protein